MKRPRQNFLSISIYFTPVLAGIHSVQQDCDFPETLVCVGGTFLVGQMSRRAFPARPGLAFVLSAAAAVILPLFVQQATRNQEETLWRSEL